MDRPLRLAIIVVLYRSYEDAIALLGAEDDHPAGITWCIVDNTPDALRDNSMLERMEATYDSVRVIRPIPENPGYLGAAHLAMTSYVASLDADFVVVANADVRFSVTSMYARLSDHYRDSAGIGMIAPRLVNSQGSPVRQGHFVMAPTKARYEALSALYGSYPLAIAHRLAADLKRLVFRRRPVELPRFIFAPHGALMVFTREFFKQTSGFAYEGFLFGEEVYVGSQCAGAGLICVFDGEITYSHVNHGSMGIFPSRLRARQLADGHRSASKYLI